MISLRYFSLDMMWIKGDKKGMGGYDKENSNGKDKTDFSLLIGAGGDKILMERMRRGEARLKEVRMQVSEWCCDHLLMRRMEWLLQSLFLFTDELFITITIHLQNLFISFYNLPTPLDPLILP